MNNSSSKLINPRLFCVCLFRFEKADRKWRARHRSLVPSSNVAGADGDLGLRGLHGDGRHRPKGGRGEPGNAALFAAERQGRTDRRGAGVDPSSMPQQQCWGWGGCVRGGGDGGGSGGRGKEGGGRAVCRSNSKH